MKKLILLLLLITVPGAAFGLEQSFTQQGIKATIKLSPDRLETQGKVQLSVKLDRDGTALTNSVVTLEIYENSEVKPFIKHPVDILDSEYVDSWKFENAGDYKIVIIISVPEKPDNVFSYEVKASVMDAATGQGSHHEGGFWSHHLEKWGWWGVGAMGIMMIPMIVFML